MGNILSFRSRKRRGAGSQGRRLSRDLFAALVVGAGFLLSLAWTGGGTAQVLALLRGVVGHFPSVETALRKDLPVEKDFLPVSSIGTKSGKTVAYPVCAARLRKNCVVDGDTFYFGTQKIRLADIDTPETHPPRCALEADLGDRATTRLSELLSAAPFELARFDRDTDRYGRKLRVAMRDGRSLGDILVSEGLARTWTGRREPWCPAGDDGFG